MLTYSLRSIPSFCSGELVKGKSFGELVKEEVTGYGDGIGRCNFDDAQDGLYNKEKAKAGAAKKALKKKVQNSQLLDNPVDQAAGAKSWRVQSLKQQSIVSSLGTDINGC